MAGSDGPEETGNTGSEKASPRSASDLELDRRRRQLDQALAEHERERREGEKHTRSSNASGYAAALRLSSEFVAGILAGVAIGWIIDRFAGTSPWGLIVFLLLGFCAGVLNILRSSGMMTERKVPGRRDDTKRGGQ
ncbi:MAG: AtpZ/AtpI family protein [Rhizobiaceae bacterium]